MENGYNYEKTEIGAVDSAEKTQMVPGQQTNATQYAASVTCPVCQTANAPSETYCSDCGFLLSGSPIVVEEMPTPAEVGKFVTSDGAREFILKAGENAVGRENADILLSHGTVSRKHAKVVVDGGRIYVEDSGSTNGTFVDGKRLSAEETVDLADGDEVVFGAVTLKLVTPESAKPVPAEVSSSTTDIEKTLLPSDNEPEPAPMAAPVATDQVNASIPASGAAGRLVSKDRSYGFDLVGGLNTIGRRPDANTIVVRDPYCSGRHADVRVTDDKFILTDTGSTNGTFVNGVAIQPNTEKEIHAGDEIMVGRTVLVLEVA